MSEAWPLTWVGMWRASLGKTVVIDLVDGAPVVTVAPGPGEDPYLSEELLDGSRKLIQCLPAATVIDDDGGINLEIEAGEPGLGPTYRLLAVMPDGDLVQRADHLAPAHRVVLLPSVGLGLYDDFDDDVGVPWAYPLDPLLPVRIEP